MFCHGALLPPPICPLFVSLYRSFSLSLSLSLPLSLCPSLCRVFTPIQSTSFHLSLKPPCRLHLSLSPLSPARLHFTASYCSSVDFSSLSMLTFSSSAWCPSLSAACDLHSQSSSFPSACSVLCLSVYLSLHLSLSLSLHLSLWAKFVTKH